ncbi:MAG: HlyD family efflux transporter periplasmic adaptor subunit, partial [Gemmatimonadaceae bacterium]
QSVASDLVLVSPVAGVVTSRNAEPGEVLGAGQAALIVGDVARPFVRIYVDERAFPLVRVGQSAVATLDAFPQRKFRGRVSAVASKAEFTPRVALTENERADLLFGVKIELTDSASMLKAGLPVTVRVITESAGTSAPRAP